MKKVIVIIALIVFLKPVFPVVDYIVNYDYISKVLCVNKEKPTMRCNGKCHLMKELAKSSETDKPLNSDKKGIIKQETETLYCEVITKYFSLTFLLENSRNKVGHYSNLYTSIPSSSVFHPPCFA